MTRISLAAFVAAAIISSSMPGFAQMNAPGADNSGQMNSSSAMNDGSMNCQGMMDKAHPMMDGMADGNKKNMAMKQMDMANTAMAAGKEKSCMSHMKSAMKDM